MLKSLYWWFLCFCFLTAVEIIDLSDGDDNYVSAIKEEADYSTVTGTLKMNFHGHNMLTVVKYCACMVLFSGHIIIDHTVLGLIPFVYFISEGFSRLTICKWSD